MRKSYLLSWKISLLVLFFALQNYTCVHALTAITAPVEMKWVIEGAKGEYLEAIGRAERYRLKKHFAQQVEQAKTELAAAETEYEQIRQQREQLIASYEADEIAREKYTEFEDVQHIYEQERNHLTRVETLQANYKKALEEQENFLATLKNLPVYASLINGAKYYSWKDNEGDSGHQFLIPFGIWSGNRNFSLGIYGNYVFAKNNSANGSGSVNAFADTIVNFTKNVELSSTEDLEFSLGVTVPTGKSALSVSELNARMSDDLVEIDKLGVGWEVNPGIKYSWRPSKHEKWTVGTNFLFSGYYDSTSDIINDDEKSGREWRKFIRYQHAEEKQQFIAELHNTSYNRSFGERGFYYDKNDEWIFKLTYNKRIAKNQELALYYWPTYQTNAQPSLVDSSWAHFYGVRWSRFINPANTLRVSFDVLNTNNMRYNGIRSWYNNIGTASSFYNEVAGRDKYTFGIGYDHYFKNKAALSFDVRYFLMHDGPSTYGEPPARYKGLNIFLSYATPITFHW